MRWLTGRSAQIRAHEERYREQVHGSWLVAAALLSGLTASGWTALDRTPLTADPETSAWAAALPLWALTLALVLILHWFLDLEIAVGHRTLALRYGPVDRELDARELAAVAVEPYDWRPYARSNDAMNAGRRRAFTAPFVRSGVVVTTIDGTRYDVASRRPQALHAAVAQLIEDHGGHE